MRYLFDPATAAVAVGAVSLGATALSATKEAQTAKANAARQAAEVDQRIFNDRLAAERDIRDLDADTEQQIALLKARAAAGGQSLSDTGFSLFTNRINKEVELSKLRLDSDTNVSALNLVSLQSSIIREGANQAAAAKTRGVANATSSLLTVYGVAG